MTRPRLMNCGSVMPSSMNLRVCSLTPAMAISPIFMSHRVRRARELSHTEGMPGQQLSHSPLPTQGLTRVVLAGDRGMLTTTQIDTLRQYPGLGWISALRSEAIRALIEQGRLQVSTFAEVNLAEITSPDFPGERLVACYNALL